MATSRVEAFRKWLQSARAGSIYVYYTGMLASDRGGFILVHDERGEAEYTWVPNLEIDALARAAIDAWDAGRVHLFQRKLHEDEYEYIAMKRYLAAPLWMPDGALEFVDK